MMNSKGQSALEYLMTYGWALVVIVIVIAALFAFGIFNPPAAGTCAGLDKFLYKDHTVSSTGVVTLSFGNGTGATIAGIGATYGGDFNAVFASAIPTTVQAGADFSVISAASATPAKGYQGSVTITYTNNTSGLGHTEIATCTG